MNGAVVIPVEFSVDMEAVDQYCSRVEAALTAVREAAVVANATELLYNAELYDGLPEGGES